MMLTAGWLQKITSGDGQLIIPQRDVDRTSKVTACRCIRTSIRIFAILNARIIIIDPATKAA